MEALLPYYLEYFYQHSFHLLTVAVKVPTSFCYFLSSYHGAKDSWCSGTFRWQVVIDRREGTLHGAISVM